MKKTKKILALVLAIFTLMSVMVIPSYAASNFPEVESVEFKDNKALSMSQMDLYFEEMLEWGELDDGVEPRSEFDEICFYLEDSGIDYELEVTLKGGKKYTLNRDNYFGETTDDGEYYINVYMYVTYAEYMKAKEERAEKMDITITCFVEDNETYDLETTEFTLEKNIIDCYVKSITPVSGIPTYVYENCDYIHNIIGGKFLVTYADNTKETLTIGWDSEMYGYTLGDEAIFIYLEDEETKLNCQFIDATYEKTVIPIAEPFESLEITRCDFNSNTGSLFVQYDIKLKKGTVQSFEAVLEDVTFDYGYYVIDSYLGFDIYLTAEEYILDGNKIDADNYVFTVDVGYENYVADSYEIENPMGFFVKIRVWFDLVIQTIRDFFDSLFGYGYIEV